MNAAKIQLSSAEMALLADPGWILTKNSIMGKAVELLAELSERYRLQATSIRQAVEQAEEPDPSWRLLLDRGLEGPKISKGENYKGLPYVILDYPRVFGKEDVFAIRTMLWWGHYFSVTLHLKGRYKTLLLPVIRKRLGLLAEHGFHIGESQEEWRHELEAGNYRPLAGASGVAGVTGENIESLLTGHPFLKLSAKCGLDRWNEAGAVLEELFQVLVAAVS